MRSILLMFVFMLSCWGCSMPVSKNGSASSKTISSEICARVDSIGHVVPLPGTERRLRWFVNLTVVSILNNPDRPAPEEGRDLQFFIHSPSQYFGNSPEDSQNKLFLVTLMRINDGWVLGHAQKNDAKCPNL